MDSLGSYSLWFLLWANRLEQDGGLLEESGVLEEKGAEYGAGAEMEEAGQLVTFVRMATRAEAPRPFTDAAGQSIRITRTLRIYIGPRELKIRPMAKSILLLFLRHPDGIVLKQIADYEQELAGLYGRLSRSLDKAVIQQRVSRVMDIFNNELNVNISRVNAALSDLMTDKTHLQIEGKAGCPKRIHVRKSRLVWE